VPVNIINSDKEVHRKAVSWRACFFGGDGCKKIARRQGQRGAVAVRKSGRLMPAEFFFMDFGIDYSIGRVRGDEKKVTKQAVTAS
jgi:hypothetical protein